MVENKECMQPILTHIHTQRQSSHAFTYLRMYVCMPVCKRYTMSLSYIVPQLSGYWRLYVTVTTITDIHSCTHRHTRTQRDGKTDRHTYVCTDNRLHQYAWMQYTALCGVLSTLGIGSHTSHHVLIRAVHTKCDLRRCNAVCLTDCMPVISLIPEVTHKHSSNLSHSQ